MSAPSRATVRRAVLSALALLLSTAGPAGAQTQASEKATLSQVVSGTDIELEYYRPSVRGRSPIWGGIIYWGEVWTPGANFATTLRLSKQVELNGVPVAPGKYGVWIEVLEDAPWTFLLHADTLRGHGNHPAVEEGLYAIPVTPVHSDAFVETLTFTIGHVRAASAELRLDWVDTRVPIELGIDPGVVVTLTPEEAGAIAGEWLFDDTPSAPSPEEVEESIAGAEEQGYGANMRRYYDALLALPNPRSIQLVWDAEHGTMSFDDPLQDEVEEAWNDPAAEGEDATGAGEQGGVGEVWSRILVPRGEGMYATAYAMNGELASFYPASAPLIEFEFDDSGQAVRFTFRGGDDELLGTAVRSPGAR